MRYDGRDRVTVNQSQNGIGFVGVLTIIFVLCKVFAIGPIAGWSWWWVFSPIWITFLIALLIIILFGLFVIWDNK